jgi:hypothetical protein
VSESGGCSHPWNPFNFAVSEFRLAFWWVGCCQYSYYKHFIIFFLFADSCDIAVRVTDRQPSDASIQSGPVVRQVIASATVVSALCGM